MTEPINTLSSFSMPAAVDQRVRAQSENSFSSIVKNAMTPEENMEKARKVAAEFVGTVFIQPIIAQMRESSQAVAPFAPTEAEKRFGPMMDALMSDRISQAANFPLTDIIAKQLVSKFHETMEPEANQSNLEVINA